MKKIDLRKIANDIKILDVSEQKETSGGAWIDTVDVIGSYTDDRDYDDYWDYDGYDDGGGFDYDQGGGSGGSGDSNDGTDGTDNNPGDNINDPNGSISGTKDYCNTQITWLQSMVDANNFSPELQEAAKAAIESMETTLETIQRMENSDLKFRFEIKADANTTDNILDGETTYDKDTGEYVIALESFDGLNGQELFIHELEHMAQHLDGELDADTKDGYDRQDEIDAYTAGHNARYGHMAGYYDLANIFVPDGDFEVTWDEIIKFDPAYEEVPEGQNNNNSGSSTSASSGN